MRCILRTLQPTTYKQGKTEFWFPTGAGSDRNTSETFQWTCWRWKRKRLEGEYYRKLAAPFIAAINVVTRCGPTMNRLLRLRERHVDLMNVRDHSSLVSNSCPCNAQYALTFKSLKMCSFISTNRFDLMSVGTGVSTYGGPIVNNPLNIYSLLKEVASHQTCYQNSLWSRLVLDMFCRLSKGLVRSQLGDVIYWMFPNLTN